MHTGEFLTQPPLEIRIELHGGAAELGEVDLEDYRASLRGWQGLIELGSRIYFLGERANTANRGKSPFALVVRAPERGSVVTELLLKLQDPVLWGEGLIIGVAGNATWDLIKTQTPRFARWLATLGRSHVDTKRRAPNIDALAANLLLLVEAPDLPANQATAFTEIPPSNETPLFDATTKKPLSSDNDEAGAGSDRRGTWLRQIIESIDISLEEASRPISGGCTSVQLVEARDAESLTLFVIDTSDRDVVLRPLSLAGEETDWERARIKFRRIDRESGSVMFRFEDRPADHGNQYGYIADKSYLRPHNPYTQALDGDVALAAWVHQEANENGGTRYAIRTARPPKQLMLNG